MTLGTHNASDIAGGGGNLALPASKSITTTGADVVKIQSGKSWYKFNYGEGTSYRNETGVSIQIFTWRGDQNTCVYMSDNTADMFTNASCIGKFRDTLDGRGGVSFSFWVPPGWYWGIHGNQSNQPDYSMQWVLMNGVR